MVIDKAMSEEMSWVSGVSGDRREVGREGYRGGRGIGRRSRIEEVVVGPEVAVVGDIERERD